MDKPGSNCCGEGPISREQVEETNQFPSAVANSVGAKLFNLPSTRGQAILWAFLKSNSFSTCDPPCWWSNVTVSNKNDPHGTYGTVVQSNQQLKSHLTTRVCRS